MYFYVPVRRSMYVAGARSERERGFGRRTETESEQVGRSGLVWPRLVGASQDGCTHGMSG